MIIHNNAMASVLPGDCIESMRHLPDQSVQMCVTSPPYFGLRDYGHAGQIGLEDTPSEFVAKMVEVFREVRRVLRDDGTLWLNLGDSYAGSWGAQSREHAGKHAPNVSAISANQVIAAQRKATGTGSIPAGSGLKPKDLIGIPWRVAFALQQPYYTGPVKNEMDRVWLAAMLDAEGSICGTEYESAGRTKTNIYLSITNTSVPIIDKCLRLFPQVARNVYEKTNGASNRTCYRWDVERMDQKALFLRTVYPYLVAKRKQAILGYTFIEMQRGLVSKKKGYLPDQHEQRSWLMASLSLLNAGQDVDLPDWVVEPPSLDEPGFYLRQEIIWHKPNPMPESVTDRCTKAHESLFLLAKSERYLCDMEAIKEPSVGGMAGNTKPTKAGRAYEEGATEHRTAAGLHKWAERQRESMKRGGFNAKPGTPEGREPFRAVTQTRNRRSVWTVATRPYKGAHFATFPPALIEPCILAGSRPGDIVLDPFGGSGTTAGVALLHGRSAMLCELNAEYAALVPDRIASIIKAKK